MTVDIKHITSRDNGLVKVIANLTRSPSARRCEGMCLLEGVHLVESYVTHIGALNSLVLRDEGDFVSRFRRENATLLASSELTLALSAKLFDELSTLSTPSGVLAVARVPESQDIAKAGFVLALDDVQDPGNVGALIRTAAAAGVDQVWLSPGSAFAWSVKTLRAAQGAHFHTRVLSNVDLVEAITSFDGERYATLPRASHGLNVSSVFVGRYARNSLLVISNEGRGLSETLYASISAGVQIPMENGVESLNAAVAGGIALYAIAQARRA